MHDINSKVKRFRIPRELVLNSHLLYMSISPLTQGTASVPIKGLTDKRCITLNFIITLANDFLPMQIVGFQDFV